MPPPVPDVDLTLAGVRVVSTAGNLPGPVAAARLRDLGAEVTKVEPPSGDPLRAVAPGAYEELTDGQHVVPLDLRTSDGRDRLAALLDRADVLLTSSRPASLDRLGLGWESLHSRYPRLVHVAVVGSSGAAAGRAGHDLTYQAETGALTPPQLPTVLLADLAGAERAVSATLGLLLRRATTGRAGFAEVSLAQACAAMTSTLRWGLTGPGTPLGGALPAYRLYAAVDGWVALAALEPHFLERTLQCLGVSGSAEEFDAVFRTRTAGEWDAFGVAHDIPLAAVRPPGVGASSEG
jgi:alpha-methylacyl-CoA racemase